MSSLQDEEHVSVPFTVQPQVLTQKQRPCVIYQEISFAEPMVIEFITFRNFYCAFVTIDQFCVHDNNKENELEKSQILLNNENESPNGMTKNDNNGSNNGKWVTILEKYSLMKYPHSENDAQKFHVIHKSMFINSGTKDSNKVATALRFYLIQPSPNWTSFGLRDLMCYTMNNKTNQNENEKNSENKILVSPKNELINQQKNSKRNIETAALLFRKFADLSQNED